MYGLANGHWKHWPGLKCDETIATRYRSLKIRNFHCLYINKVVDFDLDLVLDMDPLFDRASLDNRRLVQVQVEDQVQAQVRTIS
jgi:hypothetical protein